MELSKALRNLGIDVTIIAPKVHRKHHECTLNLTNKIQVKRVRLVRAVPFIPLANALSKFEEMSMSFQFIIS